MDSKIKKILSLNITNEIGDGGPTLADVRRPRGEDANSDF